MHYDLQKRCFENFHNAFKKVSLAESFAFRGGPRAAATSKMERFMIIVNGSKPLIIITKHSILDVAAALDPPLIKLQASFLQLLLK